MADGIQAGSGTPVRKRPGPFGPASALLPKDQQLLVIEDTMPAHEAIDRMIDNNFSQLPVKDREERIIGVFTWKSFGKRVADLGGKKLSVTELPVRDTDLEKPTFIDPEVYIDTATDWSDLDYVLVGTDTALVGILCVADVFGRLNDFAEAFVLLYEIEHEIRDLIHDVYDEKELAAALEAIVATANRPAMEVAAELKQLLDQQGAQPAIGKALRFLRTGQAGQSLTHLEDFTFSQYRTLICCEANWPRFRPVFDTMRELVDADFEEVNKLRNIVFHFRRSVTPRDTDRLRRFRDKLRYDRELYTRQQAKAAADEYGQTNAVET